MSTGFYSAAAGMLMQQRTLNVIANNMANANTAGFKAERVVTTTFDRELLRQEGLARQALGTGSPVPVVEEVATQFDPGDLRQTISPLDMAILSEGYFVVKTADDKQYLTRNGRFSIDAEGYLVLPGVGRVQSNKGDIKVDSAYFTVNAEGEIRNEKDRLLGKLKVVAPNEETQLQKFANGMYQLPGATEDPGDLPSSFYLVGFPNVAQGQYEASNANMNREMALMMQTQRTFASCGQALQIMDSIDQKTANIGAL